jgi:cell wall-associated NlpC family hydrolase
VNQHIIYDYAIKLLGLPYRWGGNSALSGFDCSGLVLELLTASGAWPHGEDSSAQGIFDKLYATSHHNVFDFGSLVFYGRAQTSITHVGFCLDNHTMIEAGGGGQRTTSFEIAKDSGAVVRIRPINYRRDLVAILMPQYASQGDS